MRGPAASIRLRRYGDESPMVRPARAAEQADIASGEMNAEQRLCLIATIRELTLAISRLNPRRRTAIMMRFGLNGASPSSYADIGRQFDVTGGRARQIVYGALHQLFHTGILGNREQLQKRLAVLPAARLRGLKAAATRRAREAKERQEQEAYLMSDQYKEDVRRAKEEFDKRYPPVKPDPYPQRCIEKGCTWLHRC